MESWHGLWNIKISQDRTQDTYFSCGFEAVESRLTLKRWNIPFVQHIKYLELELLESI
jgi:hypothetical protein